MSFPLEQKVILPARSVAILAHVFAKTPRTTPEGIDSLIQAITAKRQLRFTLINDSKVRVDFGTAASVIVNLIQGSPPDWLQLIPRGEPILQSQIFAPQLEAAVRRVGSVAKDGSGIVRMVFTDDKLTVSTKAEDMQTTAILDTINTQGAPGRTAMNYKYLIGYLSGKQGIISFSQYDKTGPVVFQYQQSPKVLIMPMQVQWDDEKPAAEKAEAEPEPVTREPEEGKAEETNAETGEQEPETQEKEPVASAPAGKKRQKKKNT
jgi:DNA polymerase III sliding clamp (beta) subunit (PCNA family)